MSDEKPMGTSSGSGEIRQKLELLVKRAGSDGHLKQRLFHDTESVLRENGVEIPAGTKPRAVVSGNSVSFEFVPQPIGDESELAENAMSAVVGGGTNTSASTTSSTTSTSKGRSGYVTYTVQQVLIS